MQVISTPSGVSVFSTPKQRIHPVENTRVTPRLSPVRSHHGERDCWPREPAVSIYTLFLNSVQVRMLWAAICDGKLSLLLVTSNVRISGRRVSKKNYRHRYTIIGTYTRGRLLYKQNLIVIIQILAHVSAYTEIKVKTFR